MILELHTITTYDGEVFDLTDGLVRFVLRTPSSMGIPPLDLLTIRTPSVQGEILQDIRLQVRDLMLDIHYEGCSRAQYWSARSALLDVLRPNRGGALTYTFSQEDGTSYSIDGYAVDFSFAEIPTEWQQWSYTDQLVLRCFDPVFYSPSVVASTVVNAGSEELVFPITFPIVFDSEGLWGTSTINYTGTWYTKPRFVVTGPFTSIQIDHQDLGIYVYLIYAAADGETVIIDLDEENPTITADGMDIFNYLSPESNLVDFKIQPAPLVAGGANTIVYTLQGDGANTSIAMQYYTRWIGI